MAKNKRTPRQQMKKWVIGGITFKARTHRVAMRRFLKGNYAHDILCRDLELDNLHSPRWDMPHEAKVEWKKIYDKLRAEARSRMSSA